MGNNAEESHRGTNAEEPTHFDYKEQLAYRAGVVMMLAFCVWMLLQIATELGVVAEGEQMLFLGGSGFLIAGGAVVLSVYRFSVETVRRRREEVK